ncbi:MAG: SLC13 family permease [Planctomycetota bacterium]|jgi:di/tricarboxylate transporter
MPADQIIVFAVLGSALVLFVWGRWRHDVVALIALLALVVAGVVDGGKAFLGFGHPAVITVAAVLVISRGLRNAGVVDMLSNLLTSVGDRQWLHHSMLMSGVALASAFMNNVGALALMMPVALESAERQKRSPAVLLMPLAFAAILGGMVTMIGTPPNIIIASIRADMTPGEAPFSLFEFTPVGIVVAVVGVLFVAVIGWRLIPKERVGQAAPENLFRVDEYITEVLIGKDSEWVGRSVNELEDYKDAEIVVVGIIRDKKRRLAPSRVARFEAKDIVILRADPTELPVLIDTTDLSLVSGFRAKTETLRSDNVDVIEAVVPPDSPLVGRTLRSLRMRSEGGVNLVAMARQGVTIRERLRQTKFRGGDVLLLQGDAPALTEIATSEGLLPLAHRHLRIGKQRRPLIAVGLFALALFVTAMGWLPAAVALSLVVLAYVLLDYVSVRNLYEFVDWSIIVLLAAMIPVGEALQDTGATHLLAGNLVGLTAWLPAWAILAVVMVVTMTLSDIINNAATAVIMAPIGVSIARQMDWSADPFLMAVAVGASCAFLTPIGHQCNTLVMGPGGYRFGDYWRMGLPLEVLIVVVSVPLIPVFWPL